MDTTDRLDTPKSAVDDATRRRRVRFVQRWILNPPMKAATWLGLVPGHVLIETIGRVSGKRRRNVVGMHVDGDVGWIVEEQGRHSGYVRNVEANPQVRVRVRRRWRTATAVVVVDDDPQARLDTFAMARHAAAVRRFGTDLLTVRIDLAPGAGPDRSR
jgi:deazaflavin-dependent oxidoreductase (nitroreductase family)